jgi:hypothetical protein
MKAKAKGREKMKYITILIIALVAINQVSAQNIMDSSEAGGRPYLRIGIEPNTMITFGYQHNFSKVAAYAEWSSSLVRFGWDNSELEIGGLLPILQMGSFRVVNNLHASAGSVETQNFDSAKFAAGDELAVGFYHGSWFFAATGEYEKIYLSHIEHTEFYRKTYYEDAKDGWYGFPGGTFQFGIEGGVTIKKKYDIHLEVKVPYTESFNSYNGSPLHVNLRLGYRF